MSNTSLDSQWLVSKWKFTCLQIMVCLVVPDTRTSGQQFLFDHYTMPSWHRRSLKLFVTEHHHSVSVLLALVQCLIFCFLFSFPLSSVLRLLSTRCTQSRLQEAEDKDGCRWREHRVAHLGRVRTGAALLSLGYSAPLTLGAVLYPLSLTYTHGSFMDE